MSMCETCLSLNVAMRFPEVKDLCGIPQNQQHFYLWYFLPQALFAISGTHVVSWFWILSLWEIQHKPTGNQNEGFECRNRLVARTGRKPAQRCTTNWSVRQPPYRARYCQKTSLCAHAGLISSVAGPCQPRLPSPETSRAIHARQVASRAWLVGWQWPFTANWGSGVMPSTCFRSTSLWSFATACNSSSKWAGQPYRAYTRAWFFPVWKPACFYPIHTNH